MADIPFIESINIKVLFAAHFTLISLSLLGLWYTTTYFFYNFILIITLLWSIHKHDSEEPIQMAIFVNSVSLILDIIVLALFYPSDIALPGAKFSAAIAIVHLIFRPVSSLTLAYIMKERTNSTGDGLANIFSGRPRYQSSYENIDRSTEPAPSQGGYTFPSAQEI